MIRMHAFGEFAQSSVECRDLARPLPQDGIPDDPDLALRLAFALLGLGLFSPVLYSVCRPCSIVPHLTQSHCGSTSGTSRTPRSANRWRFLPARPAGSPEFPLFAWIYHDATGVATMTAPQRTGAEDLLAVVEASGNLSAVNRPASVTLRSSVPDSSKATMVAAGGYRSSRRRSTSSA